jgi:hypothetical protein
MPLPLLSCCISGLGPEGLLHLCFFVCVVCCCVCERRLVLGCPPLAHKYDTSYYDIILGIGISIIVLDTHTIFVKYLVQENGGREKNDKSVVCVVCCKKLLPTTTIFPTANIRRPYEGIGIHVDDWSFTVVFFMNFELGVLFFNGITTILSHTYEGIGMFVDEWKINLISLLGDHGNLKSLLVN